MWQTRSFFSSEDRFNIENEASTRRLGNFLSLLLFRVDAGDEILKEHLHSVSHNMQCTQGKKFKTSLLEFVGTLSVINSCKNIKASKFYSLIADEATDSANGEQLSLSIRSLDGCSPKEKFLGFYQCTSGVTGEARLRSVFTVYVIMMSLGMQACTLSIVKLLVYRSFSGKMAQANTKLSGYAEGLPGEAITRYLEKLHLQNGLDPFLLASKVGPENDSPSTCD